MAFTIPFSLHERRGVSANAFAKENAAFAKWKNILGKKATVFQSPAGADAGFPDFGFSVIIDGFGERTNAGGKKRIDVHVEYKASHTAQMGSMRDWIFDGRKFTTNDKRSEQKAELIALMNGAPEAKRNAKRMYTWLNKANKKIRTLSSGSLSIIKDKNERRDLLVQFANEQPNYTIAKIESETLGRKIISHYTKKFTHRGGADGSVLLMMIGDKVWFVDKKGSLSAEDEKELLAKLGLPKFDVMKGLNAALECRIQPRGLNSPGKPVSIDVMASFRLRGKPPGGQTISAVQ